MNTEKDYDGKFEQNILTRICENKIVTENHRRRKKMEEASSSPRCGDVIKGDEERKVKEIRALMWCSEIITIRQSNVFYPHIISLKIIVDMCVFIYLLIRKSVTPNKLYSRCCKSATGCCWLVTILYSRGLKIKKPYTGGVSLICAFYVTTDQLKVTWISYRYNIY